MKKLLLSVLYGIGAFLFAGFFSAPFYHILLILFFGGLMVLVFSGRWLAREPALKDMFWLISSFLWLANVFGFVANGLNFTWGIFLTFLFAFLILWLGLPRVGRPGVKTLSSDIHRQDMVLAPSRRRTFVYGLTGALIVAEFFWTAAFLPFSYLTLAGLLFVVFYLIWTIFYHYLRDDLSREVVFKNLAFGTALFAVLLLSTKWQP